MSKCDFKAIKRQTAFCLDLMERLSAEIRESGEGSWSGMENHMRKQDDVKRIRRELLTLQDEMAVLDNLLFRFWQMGWLDRLGQPEPLTDKEQRIFLAAMEREEKACEEVDRNCVREPYEDSLMSVCKAIRRKVKDALWT